MIPLTDLSTMHLSYCKIARVLPVYNSDTIDSMHHFSVPVTDIGTDQRVVLYFRLEDLRPHHAAVIARSPSEISQLVQGVYLQSIETGDVRNAKGDIRFNTPGGKKAWCARVYETINQYMLNIRGTSAIRTASFIDSSNFQFYLQLPNNVNFTANIRPIKNHQGKLNFMGKDMYFCFSRHGEDILPFLSEKAMQDAYRINAEKAFNFLTHLSDDESKYPWNAKLEFTHPALDTAHLDILDSEIE